MRNFSPLLQLDSIGAPHCVKLPGCTDELPNRRYTSCSCIIMLTAFPHYPPNRHHCPLQLQTPPRTRHFPKKSFRLHWNACRWGAALRCGAARQIAGFPTPLSDPHRPSITKTRGPDGKWRWSGGKFPALFGYAKDTICGLGDLPRAADPHRACRVAIIEAARDR
jgi:hypothetical protein